MTDPRENSRTRSRRRTSAPSVRSSKWAQGWSRAVPIFKRHVKRPTGCRVLGSLSLLGAPARTRRGAARCQQHESARWWHLQHDPPLQSSSHAVRVVATGPHTADIGHGLLREARLGRDHHHADVEHDAFAETIGRAPDRGLSSST